MQYEEPVEKFLDLPAAPRSRGFRDLPQHAI